MNLLHAIEIRKSVRAYTQTPVEKEKNEAIIRAGSLAPVFGQFHITVIENPGLLQEIGQVTLEMIKNSGDEFLEKRAASKGYNPLYGAPVMILLSAPGGNDSKGFNMANISCAAENMIINPGIRPGSRNLLCHGAYDCLLRSFPDKKDRASAGIYPPCRRVDRLPRGKSHRKQKKAYKKYHLYPLILWRRFLHIHI